MEELNHVESQAVVLIGKGIGGYLATMMMAMVANEEEEIFKCGVVISPTTDWFRYGTYFVYHSNLSSWLKCYCLLQSEASIAERYLGNISDQQNYVLSKTDNHIHLIKNDTILLMDSFPYNPVQHFQSVKFNSQLTKAGTRFDYKVKLDPRRSICVHSVFFMMLFIGISDLSTGWD